MKTHIAAVMLAALTTACYLHVRHSLLPAAGSYPAVATQEVDVYFGDDPVPRHVRIAILYVEAAEDWTFQAAMIDTLRAEAGKLGANAIVLRRLDGPTAEEKIAAKLVDGSTTWKGEALAIRLLEEEPASGVPDGLE